MNTYTIFYLYYTYKAISFEIFSIFLWRFWVATSEKIDGNGLQRDDYQKEIDANGLQNYDKSYFSDKYYIVYSHY